MSALTIFACTFLVVLALSLQSLNVMGGHYALAFGTSIVIGGGPFGAIAAMRWHPALVRLYRRRSIDLPSTQPDHMT